MTTIRTLADAHAYYVVGLGWPCVPEWLRCALDPHRAPPKTLSLAPVDVNDPWGVQRRAREPARSPLDDIRAATAKEQR